MGPGIGFGVGTVAVVRPEVGPDFRQDHEAGAGRGRPLDEFEGARDVGVLVGAGVHLGDGDVQSRGTDDIHGATPVLGGKGARFGAWISSLWRS